MKNHWDMTWHEDRGVSPGVPDLHYGFKKDDQGHRYRIGWLELKASAVKLSKSNRITVEASQHQYIRRWIDIMPIWFLIRVEKWIYLVPGRCHEEIPYIEDAKMFNCMGQYFEQNRIAEVLPDLLKEITRI